MKKKKNQIRVVRRKKILVTYRGIRLKAQMFEVGILIPTKGRNKA